MLYRVSFLLAFLSAVSPPLPSKAQKASAVDANKYYALKTLPIGRLVLTNMKSRVAPEPLRPGSSAESVPVFNLLQAHVVLYSAQDGTGDEWFSGDLVEGTGLTPSGSMVGSFTWSNKQPIHIDLSRLNLRLKNVRIRRKVGGASITIPPSSQVIIENEGRVLGGKQDATGTSRVTLFDSTLHGIVLDWQGIKLAADASTRPHESVSLNVNLREGNVTMTDGAVVARGFTSGEITKPLESFFPDQIVKKGNVQVSGLSFSWADGKLSVGTKTMRIVGPELVLLSYPSIPVKAASEMVATDVTALGEVSDGSVKSLAPDKIGELWVKPNVYEVINELNFAGKFDQTEALLPTGDSTVRFSKASALSTFYRNLRTAQASPTDVGVNRIYLDTDRGILSDSTIDSVHLDGRDTPIREHSICVFVEAVSAEIGSHLVGKILGMLIAPEVTGPIMMAGFLRLGYALSPEIGVGFAYRVASATQFLSNRYTQRVIKFAAGDTLGGGLSNYYCELLIEKGLPPEAYRLLGTTPPNYVLHPVLFGNVQNPPSAYYSDDFGTRYRAYLTGLTPHNYTESERQLLKTFAATMRARSEDMSAVNQRAGYLGAQHRTLVDQQHRKQAQAAQDARSYQYNVNQSSNDIAMRERFAESGRALEEQRQRSELFKEARTPVIPAPVKPQKTDKPVKTSIEASPDQK